MKTLLTSVAVIAIFSTVSIFTLGGWQNFKLRVIAPVSAYFTVGNNPLLSFMDRDFAGVEENESRIDLTDLLSGGPPKDGIPSIDEPEFDTAKTTPFPKSETILAIEINGDARAYPYGILNWHEIVNDTVGGAPVSITYCPLCDTGIAFSRVIGGKETTFGVSGKLFQSCLVMYDRETDTLYSQPWGIGVAGKETNKALKRFALTKTTLGAWLAKHPDSKILATKTGNERDYSRYPYGSYFTDDALIFPVRNLNKLKTDRKELISYIWEADDGAPKNLFSGKKGRIVQADLEKRGVMELNFGDEKITAKWDRQMNTPRFFKSSGKEIPSSSAFGFVWPGFFIDEQEKRMAP